MQTTFLRLQIKPLKIVRISRNLDKTIKAFLLVLVVLGASAKGTYAMDVMDAGVTFIKTHCVRCHHGKEANANIDFTAILAEPNLLKKNHKILKIAADLVNRGEMPPFDEQQPSPTQRQAFQSWYQSTFEIHTKQPGMFKVRRLSTIEYRNTLESLLGFSLQVTVAKAQQTKVESSLVLKLLPTDPKGPSGFTNDTSENPITPVIWNNYSYLADVAVSKLFSSERRALEKFTGPISSDEIDSTQAFRLLSRFQERAWRRPLDAAIVSKHKLAIDGKKDHDLIVALQRELKAILLSPEFLYRGFLQPRSPGKAVAVDAYELAERLSYFLWSDSPDAELFEASQNGSLLDAKQFRQQVDRMLKSPKGRSIPEVFGVQWLLLEEMDNLSREVAYVAALKGQPIELLHDLIQRDRPLRELIDTKTEFVNLYLLNYYNPDQAQVSTVMRREGVELETLPLQRIELKETSGRGGLLTMPGILSMNKGAIQRGTWTLERILGDYLGEPPPNIPPVKPSFPGQKLTFRERFQQHRSNQACAVCHNRIDPLGFAFEAYNEQGGYLLVNNSERQVVGKYRPGGKEAVIGEVKIDASGILPTGERFRNLEELKRVLITSQWPRIAENLVRQMLAYALCRELELSDEPFVRELTEQMSLPDATWGDLIHSITESMLFQQTRFPNSDSDSPPTAR